MTYEDPAFAELPLAPKPPSPWLNVCVDVVAAAFDELPLLPKPPRPPAKIQYILKMNSN